VATFNPLKIILVLLLTGLACLATGAGIGYIAGELALTQSVEGRLTALREIKRRRVAAYINNELRFTTAVGDDRSHQGIHRSCTGHAR
jgi:hypothetical protein